MASEMMKFSGGKSEENHNFISGRLPLLPLLLSILQRPSPSLLLFILDLICLSSSVHLCLNKFPHSNLRNTFLPNLFPSQLKPCPAATFGEIPFQDTTIVTVYSLHFMPTPTPPPSSPFTEIEESDMLCKVWNWKGNGRKIERKTIFEQWLHQPLNTFLSLSFRSF